MLTYREKIAILLRSRKKFKNWYLYPLVYLNLIKNIIENLNKNLSIIEKIKKFKLIDEEFTIENGLMTPTLKLKRKKIIEKYQQELEKLY